MIVNNEELIIETPGLEKKESTAPITNTGVTIDPKVDPEKVVKYFKSLYKSKGRDYDEEFLYNVSKLDNIKDYIREFHIVNDFSDTLPTEDQASVIYNSFLRDEKKEPVAEKKNPIENASVQQVLPKEQVTGSTVLPSTTKKKDISLVSYDLTEDQKARRNQLSTRNFVSDVKGPGNSIKPILFSEGVLRSISLEKLNSGSEADAERYLNNLIQPYGLKASQSVFGADFIQVVRSNQDDNSSNIDPISYKVMNQATKLKMLASGISEEEIKNREKFRFDTFITELKNTGVGTLEETSNILLSSQDLSSDIVSIVSNYGALNDDELLSISGGVGGDINQFFSGGIYKEELVKSKLEGLLVKLRPIYKGITGREYEDEKYHKAIDNTFIKNVDFKKFPKSENGLSNDDIIKKTYEKYDKYVKDMRKRKAQGSSMVGSALKISGAYKNLPLNDKNFMKSLYDVGLNYEDIPTEGIKIDGEDSSFSRLHQLLTDPSSRNDVILGKIKLDIADPAAYGYLGGVLENAKNLVERQDAYVNNGGEFLGNAEVLLKTGVDTVQSLLFSSATIAGHIGRTFQDALQALGMDKDSARSIVFSGYSLFSDNDYLDDVNDLKDEYLPLWNTDITDSNSFGEALTLLSQPLAESLPYMAAYAVNPYLGISVTAASSYGGKLEEIDDLRRSANISFSKNGLLTKEEKEVLEMDDNDARWIAGSTAITETAITAATTFRYFKNLSAAKNFKGPRTAANANLISKKFASTHGKDIFRKVQRITGSPTVVAGEVAEENLVGMSEYLIMVAWGLEEWDVDKAFKLMKNTSIHSLFSASAMSRIARIGNKKAVSKLVDNSIIGNIVIKDDYDLASAKIENDADLKGVEKDDPLYKHIKTYQIELNRQILENRKRKIEIVENMSYDDKLNFLELMESVEVSNNVISSDSKNTKAKEIARQNITESKEKVKKLMMKYPSTYSYNFVSDNQKIIYDGKANKELLEEFTSKNPGLDYTSKPEEVKKRAAELFLKDLKSKNTDAKEDYLDSEFDDTISITPKKRPETKGGDFDLNSSIREHKGEIDANDKDEVDFKESEKEKRLESVNQKEADITADLQKRRQKLDSEYSDAKKSDEYVKAKESIDATYAINTKQLDDEFTKINNTQEDITKSKEEVLDPEKDIIDYKRKNRFDDFVSEIEALDIDGDFYSSLDKDAQKEVEKFFKDIKEDGVEPNFGNIKGIIEARKIALDISSKITDNIKLFDKTKNKNAGYLSSLNKRLFAWSQKNISVKIGFATGDVLTKTLFRDSYVGEKFTNLWSDLNRKASVAGEVTEKSYLDAFKQYKKDYNKEFGNSGISGKNNPNSVDNSIALYMMAGFKRQSGVLDAEGNDVEFKRWANLLKNELTLREKDYAEDRTRKNKEELDNFRKAYNSLDVENAKTYDDIKTKTSNANINFIESLVNSQSKDALDHIRFFGSSTTNSINGKSINKPFIDGTYVPVPLRNVSETESNNKIPHLFENKKEKLSDPKSLKDVSFPSELTENIRLNPSMFARTAFNYTKGSSIDVASRQDMTTLQYLLKDPKFKEAFRDSNGELENYNILSNFFANKSKQYNSLVNEGQGSYVSSGQNGGNLLSKGYSAGVTLVSSSLLAGFGQPMAQFSSAIAGTLPYIKNRKARYHMRVGSAKYLVGLSNSSSGTSKRKKLTKLVQKHIGLGDLSNIYSKSRTASRNATASEVDVDANGKIPASYFINNFDIKDKKIIDQLRAVSSMTIDKFIDIAQYSGEKNLDFWLANSDRAAGNLAFESHYINERAKQGEDFKDDQGKDINMKDWWVKENKNPNIDAINRADELISQTMRQTGDLSEASIFSMNSSANGILKTLMPFQRFVSNAKANVTNQISILNDPTIPESQKQQARKAIQGVVQEVFAYKAAKWVINTSAATGIFSTLAALTGSEEDVDKDGGYTQIIGVSTGIEDRNGLIDQILQGDDGYLKDLKSDVLASNKETVEGRFLAKQANTRGMNVQNIDQLNFAVNKYIKSYDNKLKVVKPYKQFMSTLQDLFSTVAPIPTIGPSDDLFYDQLNKILQKSSLIDEDEKVFNEYISRGLGKMETKGGATETITNNLGIASASVNLIDDMARAIKLNKEKKFVVYGGENPDNVYYLSGGNDAINEKINHSTQVLLFLRTAQLGVIPFIPPAEAGKIADYYERTLTEEYKRSKPSDYFIKRPDEDQ